MVLDDGPFFCLRPFDRELRRFLFGVVFDDGNLVHNSTHNNPNPLLFPDLLDDFFRYFVPLSMAFQKHLFVLVPLQRGEAMSRGCLKRAFFETLLFSAGDSARGVRAAAEQRRVGEAPLFRLGGFLEA